MASGEHLQSIVHLHLEYTMFLLPITAPLYMAWLIFPVVRAGERVTIPHKIALDVIVSNADLGRLVTFT
ncbi:hypothetical protein D3C80_1186030 [compost metagenome]